MGFWEPHLDTDYDSEEVQIFLYYMFEMMFSFCVRGVTGTGTGWFRVSFDTQFV